MTGGDLHVIHSLSDAVRAAATNGHASLILVAAPPAQRGQHPLGRALAEQVLVGTDLPLIVVPQCAEQLLANTRTKRVLVPLDGSTSAESAVATGRLLLGSASNHELLMLRVASDGDAARLSEIRRYVEDVAAEPESSAGLTIALTVVGDPATMITAVARAHRVGLIVMTIHGHNEQPLLGHVVVRVLQHAQVPVLLVRPAADARC
jgi:nucleotide-binding universal stress UspA family protein